MAKNQCNQECTLCWADLILKWVRPDRPRYIRWQGPSSSRIASLFYTNYSKSKIFRSVLNFLRGRDFLVLQKCRTLVFFEASLTHLSRLSGIPLYKLSRSLHAWAAHKNITVLVSQIFRDTLEELKARLVSLNFIGILLLGCSLQGKTALYFMDIKSCVSFTELGTMVL